MIMFLKIMAAILQEDTLYWPLLWVNCQIDKPRCQETVGASRWQQEESSGAQLVRTQPNPAKNHLSLEPILPHLSLR